MTSKKRLRIPLLAALLLATGYGLVHFYGSRFFIPFLMFSLLGNLTTVTLLWIERLEVLGISTTDIGLFIIVFAPHDSWIQKSGIGIAFDIFPLLIALALISIAYRKSIGMNKRKAASDLVEPERSPTLGSPIFALIVSIFVYSDAVEAVATSGLSFVWSFPFLVPPILLIWMYVTYRIELKTLNPTNNLSIADRSN